MEGFKKKLIDLIDWTLIKELEILKNIADSEGTERGTFKEWSAKDIVAHNSFWKDKRLKDIKALLEEKKPEEINDVDKVNEKVFRDNQEKSLEEIRAYSENITQELKETIENTLISDLKDSKNDLWKIVIKYCCLHPITHLDKYHTDRGHRFYTINLWKEVYDVLKGLPASPGIMGMIKYYLVPHYIAIGDDYTAKKMLSDSLDMNPSLKKVAANDPELSLML